MKKRYFDIARQLSKKAEYCHQLGAVIVKKGKIIGKGFNNPNKTHPKSNSEFKKIHAEFAALQSAGNCTGADIYIYRETKDGSMALSSPCKYCVILIKKAGIKNIYYTDSGYFKKL